MKTYSVSCLINGRSFEFCCSAYSAADAMAVARATYGPKLAIFSARVVG
jgi:hypothetical protein